MADSLAQAEAALAAIFAEPGAGAVLEEVLRGEEVSFFALCDGANALAFATAQDHKRVGEGDTGPNTGGMGAVSPARAVDGAMGARIMDEIVRPTLRGMAAEGAPYTGVLFAGVMLTPGGPQLIEYNVRFGDPETQAMLPRLTDDLLSLLLACADGALPAEPPRFSGEVAVTVVMAAAGYPAAPRTGGRDRRPRQGRGRHPGRHRAARRRRPFRHRRPRAQRHRFRPQRGGCARGGLRRPGRDRLPRRLLPPRHRPCARWWPSS